MKKAYHILGLTNLEYGRAAYHSEVRPRIAERAESRFRQILESGRLTARSTRPDDEHGHSFWQDTLAGDADYIFLSVGERYSAEHVEQRDLLFGFVFNADALIRAGALLGTHDLAADYDAIIGEVAEQVAATLPRLPAISEEELDRFLTDMGESDNAAMRAHIREQSTNPEHDLLDAIRAGNSDVEGYAQAVEHIQRRMRRHQAAHRLSGCAALEYLQGSAPEGQMEILVPYELDISECLEYILKGEIWTAKPPSVKVRP